jgi:hypothetical protein
MCREAADAGNPKEAPHFGRREQRPAAGRVGLTELCGWTVDLR